VARVILVGIFVLLNSSSRFFVSWNGIVFSCF
jgi:hypothetical protein